MTTRSRSILIAFVQLSLVCITYGTFLRPTTSESENVALSAKSPIYLKEESCPDTSKSTKVVKYGVCITACIFHAPDVDCQSTLETVVAETETEIYTNYTEYNNFFCDDSAGGLAKALTRQSFTYSKTCVDGRKYSLVNDQSPSQFNVSAGGPLNYHFFDANVDLCSSERDTGAVFSQFQGTNQCIGPIYNPAYDKTAPLYWKISCTGSIVNIVTFFGDSECLVKLKDLTNVTIEECTDLTKELMADVETMICYQPGDSTIPDISTTSAPSRLIQIKTTSKTTRTSTSCFAGSETVLLPSGKTKTISDVMVGDTVLGATKNGEILFSDVIALPHTHNLQKAEFVHLMTSNNKDIKITPGHFVLATSNCFDKKSVELILASNIFTDMCVLTQEGLERVIATKRKIDYGIYSVVLMDAEYVVVNGIVASPFANNHAVAHAFYNIHRAVYYLLGKFMTNQNGLNTAWISSAMEVLSSFIV